MTFLRTLVERFFQPHQAVQGHRIRYDKRPENDLAPVKLILARS